MFTLTIPSLEKTVPDNFKETTRNYEKEKLPPESKYKPFKNAKKKF